jgi:hypothetical protein
MTRLYRLNISQHNLRERHFSRQLSHFVAKQRPYFQDLNILHQYNPNF